MKLDDTLLPLLYMLAAMGFILAIKWMNSPATARRGVIVGEIGMLLAVVGTLLRYEVVNYQWILVAFFLGTAIGVPLAYLMPMTAVPQRTALSHACGALASALIGTAEYYKGLDQGAGTVESGDDRADRRNAARLSDLHGQHDGVRQIAGDAAAAADHVQGPELREPGSFRGGGRRWAGVDRFARAQRVCFRSSRRCRCCSACC